MISTAQRSHFPMKVAKRKRKDDAAPLPDAAFTWVHLHTDTNDLRKKKITNPDTRREIRSRVMTRQRADERAQGIVRPTGRGKSKTSPDGGSDASSTPEHISSNPITPSSESTTTSRPNSAVELNDGRLCVSLSAAQNVVQYVHPAPYYLDPVYHLFGDRPYSHVLRTLFEYCHDVFLPSVFPVENRNSAALRMRRDYLLYLAQRSNRATFYSYMATTAANRAIAYGCHDDLRPLVSSPGYRLTDNNDYETMNQLAITIIRKKVNRIIYTRFGECRDDVCDIVGAHFSLSAAAASIGNWSGESGARWHVKSAHEILEYAAKANNQQVRPLEDWESYSDITAAIGGLDRPVFELPWVPVPISTNVVERIKPPPGSPLNRLCKSFDSVMGLTFPLRGLIEECRHICIFREFIAVQGGNLTPEEQDVFRRKTHELGWKLLAYPHTSIGDLYINDNMTPIEEMTRIVLLSVLHRFAVVAAPSTGLGRSLTLNYYDALQRALTSECEQYYNENATALLVWTLFYSVEGAKGQLEARLLIDYLAQFGSRLGQKWSTFEEIEQVLYGFLYIPMLQREPWREIWKEAASYSLPPPWGSGPYHGVLKDVLF